MRVHHIQMHSHCYFYIYVTNKNIPAVIVGVTFLCSGLGKIGNVIYFQHLIVEYDLSYLNILAPLLS